MDDRGVISLQRAYLSSNFRRIDTCETGGVPRYVLEMPAT